MGYFPPPARGVLKITADAPEIQEAVAWWDTVTGRLSRGDSGLGEWVPVGELGDGLRALALGRATIGYPASGAVAIGNGATIGNGGQDAIAIGRGAGGGIANAGNYIAIGPLAVAAAEWVAGGVAIGYSAQALNISIAIGYTANAAGSVATALGYAANAAGAEAVAVGHSANAAGAEAVAVGYLATVGAFARSIAIGKGATATAADQAVVAATELRVKPATAATPSTIVLASPDGALWRLAVDNAGTLSVAAA